MCTALAFLASVKCFAHWSPTQVVCCLKRDLGQVLGTHLAYPYIYEFVGMATVYGVVCQLLTTDAAEATGLLCFQCLQNSLMQTLLI